MTILGRLLGWALRLPPPETPDLIVERNIKVPMPDGTPLLADHYAPRGAEKRPTILLRTPYGRSSPLAKMLVLPFAERGFQVLLQSCRGTFGSGGDFEPFRNERADGLATVEWLKKQPWFSGSFASFGPSYIGFTQWSIADKTGPEHKALVTLISSSEFQSPMYSGGSFWLDTSLTWSLLVRDQEKSFWTVARSQANSQETLRPAFKHLPLREADITALGTVMPFLRDWLEHTRPDDPWWKKVNYRENVANIQAPVLLMGGFYDIFLPQTILDYNELKKAGRNPYLTLGPWHHTDLKWLPIATREALAWFRAHLLGDKSELRSAPVRVFVMGGGGWKEFEAWPPPGSTEQRWYLQSSQSSQSGQSGNGLSMSAPDASPPDSFLYDPTFPTPAVGGSSLSENAGAKDNRALEARTDVLVYSSAPLDRDVEVIGPVRVELFVKSSIEHADFFVRLCNVSASGKSINVSDGLLRIEPGQSPPDKDGARKIAFDLWPTACLFKRGHRIRVQVSGGAHPRYARNTGSGEPLATATKLVPSMRSVYHDPAHPSAIILSVQS